MAKRDSTNPYYQGPISDHFDGTRFFVPGAPVGSTDKSRGDLIRFMFRTKRARWPDHVDHPPCVPAARIEGADLRVTSIGHASVLIQTRGVNLLVDPVWSTRASPFTFAGPKRVTDPGVALADLPRLDAILITHNHYDHMDVATLKRLQATNLCRIITSLGNDTILRKHGLVAEARDWGERIDLAPGIAITPMPSLHWSARGLGDRRMALWGAFVIETPDGPIYHIGDTAYGDGTLFRAIPKRFGRPRLSIIPIGAYEPRWFMRTQHVDPDESVRVFEDCETHYALAHHWGTFQLTAEAIDEPPARLASALQTAGIAADRFRVQPPGQTFEVPRIG